MSVNPNGIFDIIERGVAEHPDSVALSFQEQDWTWTQLRHRVLCLATALRAAGVDEGDRVAFVDKNHPACIETTFAASLLGAANTIINFRLAEEELTYVIGDSAAEVVIVGHEFAETLGAIRQSLPSVRRMIVLGGPDDELEALIERSKPIDTRHEAQEEDCFLQLYTSGTTGWPKGAMLTQRGLDVHSAAVTAAYEMDRSTVNVVAMPLFHVGGTCWALGSLHAGGHTVIVREMVPGDVLRTITRSGATHAFFVPAVIQMLLAEADVEDALNGLKVLGYGGSPMPPPLMERTLATLDTPLYSVYGMTEMSGVFCVLGPDEHRDEQRTYLRMSAGRPLAGTDVRVVDPVSGEDVATGEVGEFWVRSGQVMSGYWNKPDATASTFVDGWLRSGDAGRRDADGYLYIEDRVKDMVISGGENIYPSEVERVLLDHPDVAEVAVIGVPDEKWGETVHAVVVTTPGTTISQEELLSTTHRRLARYKRPTGVTFLDAMPRNATGKILKRDLRKTVG